MSARSITLPYCSFVIILILHAAELRISAQQSPIVAKSIRFSPKLILGRADYQYQDDADAGGGGGHDSQSDDMAAHSRQKRYRLKQGRLT